ncbi:MAG TPA: hypothetical protein VN426_09740 [Syntrophomonadaceae bacterium]|nr:hypothetical protein [Syntrophomonadaceae bacterium]
MHGSGFSRYLLNEHHTLRRFLEGKSIKKILGCTDTCIALLMDDGTIVKFLQLEDELIFDIEAAPCQAPSW